MLSRPGPASSQKDGRLARGVQADMWLVGAKGKSQKTTFREILSSWSYILAFAAEAPFTYPLSIDHG